MKTTSYAYILLSALLIGSGCESPTGLRSVTRQLEALFVAPYPMSLSDSGVLLIAGALNDPRDLTSHQRLTVNVTTSRGDAETVGMGSTWCPVGAPVREIHCYTMVVVVFPDANREDILRRIRAMNLIPTGAEDGTLGWALVGFDPLRIEQHARTIRQWDGVQEVVGIGIHFADNPANSVAAPIRVSGGPPTVGDGRLQLQAGDVLTGIYVNPSGDTLRTTFTVPAMTLRSPP